jgi:biotin transporter BioY
VAERKTRFAIINYMLEALWSILVIVVAICYSVFIWKKYPQKRHTVQMVSLVAAVLATLVSIVLFIFLIISYLTGSINHFWEFLLASLIVLVPDVIFSAIALFISRKLKDSDNR